MKYKIFILISCCLLHRLFGFGQCPESDSLWKRLIYLRDSSNLAPEKQLQELLVCDASMKNCVNRNDSSYEFLLRRIGASYFQLGDYLRAALYLRNAISVINTNPNNPAVHLKQLVPDYYWLSRCYDSLNLHSYKLKALDSCATIASKLKIIDKSSLWALYARVEYSFDVGDYERCIHYATLCEMLGNEYAKSTSDQAFRDGTGYASSSLEWNVNALLALKKYDHAERLLADRVEEYQRTGFLDYLGIAYEQLAKVEVHKGNYNKALFYFNQAVAAEKKTGHGNRCRTLFNDIGYEVYFLHFHDPDKALFYYKKALTHVSKKETLSVLDSMGSLNILDHMADAYIQKGLYDSAFSYFQLAFDQIRHGISESDILYSPSEEFERHPQIYDLISLLIDKGDAYRRKYEVTRQMSVLGDAIRVYKVTDLILDRIKTEQFDLRSKLFWRSDTRRLYDHAIEACYLQRNPIDAFYFFEKSRAVLLNDQLREQNWLGENDIVKQTQLKRRILQMENESSALDINSSRFKELQFELFKNRQQLDGLIQLIGARNPLFYQDIPDSSKITVQDVRKNILNDHQALIELFSGDSAVYSLVITAKDIQFSKIDKIRFDSLTSLFNYFIADAAVLSGHFYRFEQVSNQLYKLIFQDNFLPPGRIVISPDVLNFPFEALVKSIQPLTYIIADHSVTYTYSARYLMNRFASVSGTGTRNFLGIAPVEYPSALHLATLKGSDISLGRIRTYFTGADNLIAAGASKNNFLQMFSKYQVIQLYTHASGEGRNGEPVIYFSDSALFFSDILGEDKPVTRLIVLSACETGNGTLYKGEGIFSMSRAFAALGIPSSISNLWTLDNICTYRLTELFYKYLATGLPTDMAMQSAKLEFIKSSSKTNKLPYYWAGSILVGKSYIIKEEKRNWWVALLAILTASMLLTIIWHKFFKKNLKSTGMSVSV